MSNQNPTGQVHITNDVLATIAGAAVLEAEGVASLAKFNRKKLTRGVSLKAENGKVLITVDIIVRGGVKIQKVALDVQQRVKTAIETMTGFIAEEVNVHVTGLVA